MWSPAWSRGRSFAAAVDTSFKKLPRQRRPIMAQPPQQAQRPQQPATPANTPIERIQCQWCQAMNEKTAVSCRACGAPLDIKNLVSESGWREAPRIKDMTEIHFGQSTCQVEGEIVPVAEINLGPQRLGFFRASRSAVEGRQTLR